MKQKSMCAFLIAIVLMVAFSACSGENSKQRKEEGVPENQVRSSDAFVDFEMDYSVTDYRIFHDVDMDTHMDHVTLLLSSEQVFAAISREVSLMYQYYKSDDMWILVDYYIEHEETRLNADAFVTNPEWSGAHSNSSIVAYYQNAFVYNIHIKELNLEDSTITISYEIEFDNELFDDLIQTTPVTMELDQGFGGSVYILRIDEAGKELPWEEGITFYLSNDGLTENNYN